MKLSRIFQDNMILQYGMPVCIWGNSDKEEDIQVKINNKKICDCHITKGDFAISLPPQEVMTDATIEIGDITLNNIDFGDVYVASGQSNMEFLLQYEEHYKEEKEAEEDNHLRMYTVARYSFEGERELGYKAWNPWDKWYSYKKEDRASFSAPATYFAKELRKKGIPVGIVNCSWGGTIAISWTSEEYIAKEEAFASQVLYAKKLDEIVDNNNLQEVKVNFTKREASADKNDELLVLMGSTKEPDFAVPLDDNYIPKECFNLGVNPGDLIFRSKGSPNYPSCLYNMMLKEVYGFSTKGVLWYQGESDQDHASDYGKLFACMVQCWRDSWLKRNPGQISLPFITSQLAPFGFWLGNTGVNYPTIRNLQLEATKTLKDVYIVATSDIGNVYDIHPKNKKTVGYRYSLIADKFIYGKDILAQSPVADKIVKTEEGISVSFSNADGLFIKEDNNEASKANIYNGFNITNPEFLPAITGEINGLCVKADGRALTDASCFIKEDKLFVNHKSLKEANKIEVELGQTSFYQMNLYNKAGLPALACKISL